jgi:hypothetical protein
MIDPDAGMPDDLLPVDSEVFRLPDGRTVIGRDAYEAELVRSVFRSG